jgi:hypothetical protein
MIQIGGKSTMPFSDKKTYPQYFSKNNRVGGGIGVGVSEYNLGAIVYSPSQSLVFWPLKDTAMQL